IEGDVPVGMKIKLGDFAEAISTRLWKSVGRANWRSFEDARGFVRGLGLKSQAEWRIYLGSGSLPPDIPANPNTVFANKGWSSWGDWFGTGFVAHTLRQYRPFKQARAHVQGLKLKSETEWRDYTKSGKKPDDIPADPVKVYANDGWAGMGDWLGTGTVAPRLRQYRSFKEARAFVRGLELKSNIEWLAY